MLRSTRPGPGNRPPAGTEVQLAGLPVLAASSNSSLASSRYWLTLAGLAAVALALLAVYRSLARALVPLIPIVLATGWASLVLFASHIELNPMSATLGALVIAIATEFSVILASRYREEREAGRSVGEALRRSYSRTGAAVLASGLTAIAGFATLIVTAIPGLGDYDFPMLRDFGLVTVVDLGVALLGVMLVLPAVWSGPRRGSSSASCGPRGGASSPAQQRPTTNDVPGPAGLRKWEREPQGRPGAPHDGPRRRAPGASTRPPSASCSWPWSSS